MDLNYTNIEGIIYLKLTSDTEGMIYLDLTYTDTRRITELQSKITYTDIKGIM